MEFATYNSSADQVPPLVRDECIAALNSVVGDLESFNKNLEEHVKEKEQVERRLAHDEDEMKTELEDSKKRASSKAAELKEEINELRNKFREMDQEKNSLLDKILGVIITAFNEADEKAEIKTRLSRLQERNERFTKFIQDITPELELMNWSNRVAALDGGGPGGPAGDNHAGLVSRARTH